MPLLTSRRFLPLFAAQALGALNDNLFRNAVIVTIAFQSAGGGALVALAGALFTLPYLFGSATAGELADRFAKPALIRASKAAELVLLALAVPALLALWLPGLLAILLLLGLQATVFGPLKYGVLPELLAPAELMRGNALIEAGTFVAILLGTIAGGVLIALPHGPVLVACAAVVVAAAGLAAAWAVPRLPAAAPGLGITPNPVAATGRLVRGAMARPAIAVAIGGLSWFWAMGAVFLAQFPVLARVEFGADPSVVTLLLAAFSVGVAAGSLLMGRRGRARAEALAPVCALGLSAAMAAFALLAMRPAAAGWVNAGAMLQAPSGLLALAALAAASGCGGAFSVPLYARLQVRAAPAERARIVAANNVVNAAYMVGAAVVVAALAAAGLRPGPILLLFAGANAAMSLLLRRLLRRAAAVEERHAYER